MDPKMIDVLVCPICKGPLRLDREQQLLICEADRLAYPIRDGVPIMLEEEAQPWTPPSNDPAAAIAEAVEALRNDQAANSTSDSGTGASGNSGANL